VDFSKEYAWMTDFMKFTTENFKEEYVPSIQVGTLKKAKYDRTPYGYGIYDPRATREFIRATFMRLRLLRTADLSWIRDLRDITEYLKMAGVTDEHIYNRLMMIMSAQRYAFVLGLSVLGRSRLCKVENGWAVIPIVRHDGKALEVRFRTLDHLLFGFILGVTPLGYGLLLPKKGVLRCPEGKKNPRLVEAVRDKVKGIRDRHLLTTFAYCYDENTEVLTKEGFKKFSELSYDDEIATLNPETDEIEYQRPIAIHKFSYKGKMVHIVGRSIDLLVTPEHRLYCANFFRERKGKNEGFKFIEAIKLVETHKPQKYKFKRTAKWKGVDVEYFELPGYERSWVVHGSGRTFKKDEKLIPVEDWLGFLAWYIAEGDTSTYGMVRIANTKEENLQEILELCKRMGFDASIYKNSAKGLEKAGVQISSVQLWKYLRQFGNATEKFIPSWIKMLPPDKLKIFLETLTKGDGHKDSRNWKYYTSSKRLADDVQEIAIKAGYAASVGEHVDTRFGGGARIYIVHIDRKRKDTTITRRPELIDYDGLVYDVTVPKHHIILVRRNGKVCWSSNSNYNKPEEMVDYHKSHRTASWHYIQAIRRRIEEWVDAQVRDVESDPIKVRQYKSAALQAIFWRAKRHRWGFQGFQALTDDEWRGLWKDMWTRQGLDPAILDRIYEGMEPFVEAVRRERIEAGEEVKRTRTTMALVG
jgi:intein/homing endonuclease